MPLPKITECMDNNAAPEGGVGRTQLVRACLPFMVVGALCLAHIHLQFVRADMLMQTSQLQSQQRVLQRQLAFAERQVQAVDFEQLRMRGKRDLQMEEVQNPTTDLLAMIPAEVQRKYQQPLREDSGDVMVAQMRSERNRPEPGLKETLLSLLESGRAVASVTVGAGVK
jgi:hypothetical protein